MLVNYTTKSGLPWEPETLKQWAEDQAGPFKWKGYEGQAQCKLTSHNGQDKNPSFSFNAEKGTGHCFACHEKGKGLSVKEMAAAWGCEVPPMIQQQEPVKPGARIVRAYNYTDEAGNILYQSCRMEPKKFFQRRTDGKGGWINNLDGVKSIPYRLPELIRALEQNKIVFVVEGEKDADRLRSLDVTATTNSGGAGKWTDEHSKYFPAGSRVIILPDNDTPGRNHAQAVARSLHGRGCSVKIIELPGLPEKGDVSDWLDAGHTKNDLIELYRAAKEWTPEGAPGMNQDNGEPKTEEAVAWPEPMEGAAFYGLAGRITKAIAPETEADEAAILINVLLAFGAMVGRGPYIRAGGVRHGCNLFACLTGGTSKGRKGSSWGPVERLFKMVEEDFIREKTPGGLSTGEGLIWAVRDPIYRPKKRRPGEHGSGEIEMEIEIPGVDDKRLLLIESELGQVLQVLKREGNTLSAILRQAWDGKECLQSLTKAVKGKTTGAHISMIGHVTKDELTANFASVELLNGLGNRILWVCVRRSKLLPEGGNIPDLAEYAEELAKALSFASTGPECCKSEDSIALWRRVYPILTDDRAGLWGAATARAEAQVTRLAMIYSLMDCTDTIRPDHLRAALAVWGYCEDSAKFIFSGQADDPVTEKILSLLESGPKTQTAINDYFGGHVAAKSLRAKIETLSAKGRVICEEIKTAGRPRRQWKLIEKK